MVEQRDTRKVFRKGFPLMPAPKKPAKKKAAPRKRKPREGTISRSIAGPSEVMDLDEAAAYLRVSRTTVYKLAQTGKIPAFKLKGMWRFRLESLRAWTEQLEREQRGEGK